MPDLDISCRELTRETTEYLDHAMTPRARTTFEQHLVFCPYCVVHLQQVRATREVLGSLADAVPPQETDRAVRNVLG
jgi:anti-sigma factor RsiW